MKTQSLPVCGFTTMLNFCHGVGVAYGAWWLHADSFEQKIAEERVPLFIDPRAVARRAETASTPAATDLWELRVADEEYQLEVARLKPLADRLARLDFALAEEEDEDARDRLGVERAAILSKMRGDDFWLNQGGGNGQFG